MLCAEGRIVSTKEGNGGKEEKAEQCMAEEKRLGGKKLTGNMTVVKGGHVKTGCTDSATAIV